MAESDRERLKKARQRSADAMSQMEDMLSGKVSPVATRTKLDSLLAQKGPKGDSARKAHGFKKMTAEQKKYSARKQYEEEMRERGR